MLNQITTLTADKAVLETALGIEQERTKALQVAAHQSKLRQNALDEANNNAVRAQRDATNSFKEGLHDDTHTDDTYINSLNRALAGSLNSLQGATTRDNPADNH
ncbi:MAG: hypothetical protein K0U66_04775 [Gammaproteobacteria bacterium]|nr:hypothetical protein [Gammaproteobacteria bacterium]